MAYRDMREFCNHLEKAGELKRVKRQVEVKYEIAAGTRRMSDSDGPALLFEHVRGYDMPVVGGLCLNRKKALLALGVDDNKAAVEKFLHGLHHPIPTQLVDYGPCKEVIKLGDDVDLHQLPIPTYSERDSGPYITMGVQISKDPETRTKNAAIYRMELKGKTRLGIMSHAFQHLATQFAKAEAKGEALEVAVAIGLDPVTLYASQAKVAYGVDELSIAGGINGSPVEVVKCETVDLEVPSTAEIIIEGRVLPNVREKEGPFGEFTGYYGQQEMNPIVEITAITHRKDAIYQAGLTGIPTTENHVLKIFGYECHMYETLKKMFPEVQTVCYPTSGGVQYVLIVSLQQRYKGEARHLILAALGDASRPKYVVVVDDDIDIYDPEQVNWAIATRCQPAEDVIIIPNVAGGPLDPSAPEKEVISVMGIDATRPFGAPFPAVVRVPGTDSFSIE